MFKYSLAPSEKRAFVLHTLSNIFEGVFDAVIMLNSVVLLKALMGSEVQVSTLFQLMIVVFVTSIFFNEFLKRVQNKKRMLRVVALATRLPFVLFFFFPEEQSEMNLLLNAAFIGIFFIGFLARPIIYPTINLFLRNIYQKNNFGPLYAVSFQIRKIIHLIVIFLFGLLMDFDSSSYTYIYPISGILTIVGVYIFSMLDYKAEEVVKTPLLRSVVNSLTGSYQILKQDKAFRDFEIGYMIYGFAWLISYPVLSVYLVDVLGLNYSGVAMYTDIFLIGSIFILPFFGKLLEKMDPRKYAVIVFASLAVFFVLTSLTEYFNFYTSFFEIKFYPVLIVAYLFHAVFTASQNLLWNIGSSYFAKASDTASYQSIHLTGVGLRAIIAPLLGIGLYKYFGFATMFGVSCLILIYSVIYVNRSANRIPINSHETV